MHKTLMTALVLVAVTAVLAHAGDIHRAIEAGDLERVALLLDENPELIQSQDESQYQDLPLHVAAAQGNVEIATLLIERGAKVDAGDSDRSTPLHVAAVRRQVEMVRYLMAQGADLAFQDNNGAWSISFAASAGDSTIVYELAEAGAPLGLRTNDGLTLLHYAVRRGLLELMDMTIAAGIDPSSSNNEGETVLHWAAFGNDTEVVTRMLRAGAKVNATDNWGNTPLHSAIWREQTEVAAYLIDHGADVNSTDNFGRAPLSIAAGHGNLAAVRLLVEQGADLDQETEFGETALLRASQNGHAEVTKLLVDAGTRTSTREAHRGNTALHIAAMSGYGDIVEQLAAASASLDGKNAHGETALDLANRYGNPGVAKTLIAKGAREADPPAACPAEDAGLAACKPGERPEGTSQKALAIGEAKYWYMGHSGYAIQTQNHLMIFDYFSPDRPADNPALSNGFINPLEIENQNVTVFVSHDHGDHFDPEVFEWAEKLPKVQYVMGCDAETDVPYERLQARETREMNGMTVHAINSNDSGLGFLVEVDGLVLFHPGDHANRQQDFSGPYAAEIDWLAETGLRPDLSVMPVSGCGFGDLEAVRLGVHYAFEKLQPRVFLPAHALNGEYRYAEFVERAREESPQVRMVVPQHRGDHFLYRKDAIW